MSGIKMNKYKEEDYCPCDGTKLSGNWGGFINGYKKKIRVWVCKKCGYRATKERDD